jgi:serine protease AprX
MKSAGKRGGVLALASAIAAAGALSGGASPQAAVVANGSPARMIMPLGIASSLRSGAPSERVRVSILLRAQPVLARTGRVGFERRLDGSVSMVAQAAARHSPAQITMAEKLQSVALERRRARVIDSLRARARRARRAGAGVATAVRRAGGRVVGREIVPASVVARVPRSALEGLIGRGDVQAIMPAPKPRPQSGVWGQVTGAPSWWSAGFNGGKGVNDADSNVAVYLGSDAPDAANPAFSGGPSIDLGTCNGSPGQPNDHGTHTGGIIASQDSTFRGIGFGVSQLIGGCVDENGAFIRPHPADVMSLSFGGTATNDDADQARDLEAWTYGAPIAAAAGNANDDPGVTPGSPTVGNIGRNILSVGAFADQGTVSTADDQVAGFSSFGPSPGGRKKPDLTAPGVGITAPACPSDTCTGGPPPGTFFTSLSGTSFSTPMVGGAMALLRASGIASPMAINAILINSAHDWCNGHNDVPTSGPPLPTAGTCQSGWEPDIGWGVLDLTNALAQRANFQLGTVAPGQARFYRATAAPADKTTLQWFMRGIFRQGTTPLYYTVSNLDLHEYVASSGTEVPPAANPWAAGPDAQSTNDTVEQIRAPAGPTQSLIYKVDDASSTIDGASSEPFAIASHNPLTPLANPTITPTGTNASPGGTINCQTPVTVTSRLQNSSPDLPVGSAQVSLSLPAGMSLVSGAQTQQVAGGTLASGQTSEQHTWTVQASSSGSHALTITGAGAELGQGFQGSGTVQVSSDCRPGEVNPSDVALSPAGPVQCGQSQTITADFKNPALTPASGAAARLDLPSGVTISGSQQTQTVSGGTLGAGATSEGHSWTVVPQSPTSAPATLTGLASPSLNFPSQVSLPACTAPPRVGVRLASKGAAIKGRRLQIHGQFVPKDGSSSSRVSGAVSVHVQRPGRDRDLTAELSGGGFGLSTAACRAGTYAVRVKYAGSQDFKHTRWIDLGSKRRRRGC